MTTISRLSELRSDELEKIRKSLRAKFGIGKRGNIVEVAFGVAERRGELDHDRSDAICFYVSHKRTPRAKRDRIPPVLEVRLRRGRGYCCVRMPTDVIRLGTLDAEATGRRIRHVARSRVNATAGCVLIWRVVGQTRFTWGVLSVGHYFASIRPVPEASQGVLVRFDTNPTREFRGTLLARSRPRDGSRVDAAIVRVQRATLVATGLVPDNVSTVGLSIRELDELKNDVGKPGRSVPGATNRPLGFRVARYAPVSNVVPALGLLRGVIEAVSPTRGAFGKGRSGSVWTVGRELAATQHGGQPRSYRRGWGQSLEVIATWSRAQLAGLAGVPVSKLELRIIRVI